MWDRIEKIVTGAGLKRLSNSKVGIVGVGSLGSWTAVLLAMSGVGEFILADPDKLEDHNTVRHAADLRYVTHEGLFKTEAVKDLILNRNREVKVQTINGDARTHSKALAQADLVIVAGLGSEMAQGQMGQLLRKLKKPTLFGGLYARGVAGEVLFVDAKDGPCYSCFATYLRDQEGGDQPTAVVNYGLPPDEVKAEPALGVHVVRVATVLTDWALRILVQDPKVLMPYPGNLVIVSNEKYELGVDSKGSPVTSPPASSWWTTIPRNPSCRICGSEVSVSIPLDQLLKD